jgi:hypothetical protein
MNVIKMPSIANQALLSIDIYIQDIHYLNIANQWNTTTVVTLNIYPIFMQCFININISNIAIMYAYS